MLLFTGKQSDQVLTIVPSEATIRWALERGGVYQVRVVEDARTA